MQPNFTPAAGRPCSPSSNLPPQLQPDLSFLPLLHHLAPRSPASPRDCLPGTVITACRRRRLAKKATALTPSSLRSSPRLPTLGPAMQTLLVAKVSKREWVASLTSPNCPPQLQFPELGSEIGASALPFPPLPQAHSVQPGSCLRPVLFAKIQALDEIQAFVKQAHKCDNFPPCVFKCYLKLPS